MNPPRRKRVHLALMGDPEAVALAADALERLLGSATFTYGPIAPSQRREGQAHIGGTLLVVLDRDERGPGLREERAVYTA